MAFIEFPSKIKIVLDIVFNLRKVKDNSDAPWKLCTSGMGWIGVAFLIASGCIPRSLLRVRPRNPQINTPLLAAGMVN